VKVIAISFLTRRVMTFQEPQTQRAYVICTTMTAFEIKHKSLEYNNTTRFLYI